MKKPIYNIKSEKDLKEKINNVSENLLRRCKARRRGCVVFTYSKKFLEEFNNAVKKEIEERYGQSINYNRW